MRIKADEIILLFDENKNKNVCFHVIGVVDLQDTNSQDDSEFLFVLLLPELDDSSELDSESPLLVMRFIVNEGVFELIDDPEEFNRICDLIIPLLEKPTSTDNPLYINGERVINTFEL